LQYCIFSGLESKKIFNTNNEIRFDGISLLPVLLQATKIQNQTDVFGHSSSTSINKHVPGEREIKRRYFSSVDTSGVNSSTSFLPDRIFLWHKDTDPFSRDERVQSAGYFEHVKIITSTNRGCLDRVFDLRHDPLERNNLFSNNRHNSKHCSVHFEHFEWNELEKVIPKDLIDHAHCISMEGEGLDSCLKKSHGLLVWKVHAIMSKLSPFAHFGNSAHSKKYLSTSPSTSFSAPVCVIPGVSQVRVLDFAGSSQECKAFKWGCSFPEY
jgi:hypothetical protein